MARKPVTDMSAWPSLTLEGNLIAPAMVAQLAAPKDNEETQKDYRIRKGLTLREEVSTAFRVGQSHFEAFAKLENPTVDATRRFVRAFLAETFDFDDLVSADSVISFLAGGRVPIVVVPPSEERLDRRSPTLSIDRSRSPAFALQDYLNEHDEALWGLVTNGTAIRLMRDNASLTRPAYIEADLAAIFTNEDAASFAVLWSLIHRTRFGAAGASVTDCALERWREAGSREGEAARDRLADQVETALKVLGSGFLEANPDLAARLKSDEIDLTEWFNELLRLVYRLIFLMVAEDRNLLHPETAKPDARKLYAEGYSLAGLRAQAARAATWDKHHDRYESIKIVFRGLAHGQDALGLPALGGLFSADKLPHLETARLRNRAFMEALYRLSWLSDKAGIVPVNWRAMETEELGSVYESLLELQPQLGDDGRTLIFASEAAEQKGNQRKTTGSYYTPDSLVQALLDTALDPVLDKAEAEAADPTQALLKLSVIDPACGSGHFLLAAARRIATRVARNRAEGTPSLADFRHALRDVARCCIYGVDRNPMAVELTKVALWIETVDPGLPLGFFDAQIRCGDALLGVFDLKVLEQGIPDAAYKPLTNDDKEVAKHYAQKNKREKAEKDRIAKGFGFDRARDLMQDFEALRVMPESTVEQIEVKAARLRALTAQGASAWQLETACDLYVAAFLLPKMNGGPHAGPDGMPRRGAETVPTSGTLWEWLRGVQPFGPLFGAAIDSARSARAFHWSLEFPDVMARGGFDLVLGNPPWDTMSPDYKEFFSTYDTNVRHLVPAEQKIAYEELLLNPTIAERWGQHCEALYSAVHFIKSSGRYRLFAEGNLGKGDFNVYRMFVETALAATRNGRVSAQFVPEGLYNGANATAIRKELFTKFQLERLAGFENTKGIWFPAIDTRMKFCFYVAWKGGQTESFPAAFRVNTADKLQDLMAGRTLSIPVAIVEEFSPDAMAVMEFGAQSEIDVCAKMYKRYPKFGTEIDGAPYRHYMREVDMGTDRGLFSEGDDGLAVFEGRMIDAYDYRAKGYVSGRGRAAVWDDLPFGSPNKRIQPQWRILPQNIPDKLAGRIDRYRIGFGDVASPTNQRSLIAALLPAGSVSGHKVPTIEFVDGGNEYVLFWLGVANSFAMDYLVRKKVSLTMSYTIMDTLPFPRDCRQTPAAIEIARRACALCAVGPDMQAFREAAVGAGILSSVEDVVEDPDRRAVLTAEIDVLVAREIYGLGRDEMRYILDPANILGEDCGIETFKALRNYEQREFNEFRTKRLVLEAWKRMEAGQPSETPSTPVELPPLEDIPNGAWAWAHGLDERDRVRAQLRAMAGILPSPADARRVRLATLACLNPALLAGFLSSADRTEWQRIARPNEGVTAMMPPTNAAWGVAYNELVSAAVLDVSADGSEWSAGPRLDRSTLHINDAAVGRALFAWSRLQSVDLEQGLTRLSAEIIPFIREGRLAA